MDNTVDIQELAIVVVAKGHNPTILNPDFLKYSGIVPSDWELARKPICSNHVAEVMFQNQVRIVAELNRITFFEAMTDKGGKNVAVPGIARKYVETLPHIDYQQVGINFRGHSSCTQGDTAHKYLHEALLSPGPWQELGQAPVRATVNLAYVLERSPLNLSITEAALQLPDETTTPVVLFSGSFSYNVASNPEDDRLRSLYQAIENWQYDLEAFEDLINTKFLANMTETKAAVPDLLAMGVGAS